MSVNLIKLISPPFQCTSITNRVLNLFDRFTAYYNWMTWNVNKTHISAISVHKYHKSCSQLIWPLYGLLQLYEWNLRKLVSPRFQCRSITNRVLSLFDRFTAYYNCMTWNVRKLISPPFQCTSITNRVLSLFDRFYVLLQLYDLKLSENSYLRHFSAQVSQIVFLAYLTVLHGLLQLYDLKCQKTHISAISVHKYHKSCS